jgi:hypothetical protein
MRTILTLVTLFNVFLSTAQDLIIKKNGDEVKGKVLEINTNEIKYKALENMDGPVYSILKSNVFMVKYENGVKEVITSTDNNQNTLSPTNPTPNQSALNWSNTQPTLQKIEFRDGKYYQNGYQLTNSKLYSILNSATDTKVVNFSRQARQADKSGNGLIIASIPLLSAGLLIGGISALVVSSLSNSSTTASLSSSYTQSQIQDASNLYQAFEVVGFSMAGIGAICLGSGIGEKSTAKKKLLSSVDLFNASIATP